MKQDHDLYLFGHANIAALKAQSENADVEGWFHQEIITSWLELVVLQEA